MGIFKLPKVQKLLIKLKVCTNKPTRKACATTLTDRVNRFQLSNCSLFPTISISFILHSQCHLNAELLSVLVPLK